MTLASLATRAASFIGLVPRAQRDAAQALAFRERQRAERASGVRNINGAFYDEQNKALQGTKWWDVRDRMEADARIKRGLSRVEYALENAEWNFEAASDKPRDQEFAELANCVLLSKVTDRFGYEFWPEDAFPDRLHNMLDAMPSGFAAFYKSWKTVKGYQVYDRLQWLEPTSIDPMGWDIDGSDRIVRILRTYQAAGKFYYNEPVLPENLSLYVWDRKGARYTGRSFFRSAYLNWYMKVFMQEQSAVYVQRAAGGSIPIVEWSPEYGAENQQKATELAQSARGTAGSLGYFAGPQGPDGKPGVTLRYAGENLGSVEKGFRALIEGEDYGIDDALYGGSSGLGRGTSPAGSRSLGETQSEQEYQLPEMVAKRFGMQMIYGVANLEGELVGLKVRNYADGSIREMPQLVVKKIRSDEDVRLEQRQIEAWKAGVVPHVADARRQICEGLTLTLDDADYEVEEIVPGMPGASAEGAPAPAGAAKAANGGGEPTPATNGKGAYSGGVVDASAPYPLIDNACVLPASVVAAAGVGDRKSFADCIDPNPPVFTGLTSLRSDIARIAALPEGSKIIPDGGAGVKPRGWFRAPTAFEERFVRLGEIERGLTAWEQRYYSAASTVIRQMERDIVERVKDGRINARNYASLWKGTQGPNLKYRAGLRTAIKGVLVQASRFGGDEVKVELVRQRAHIEGVTAA